MSVNPNLATSAGDTATEPDFFNLKVTHKETVAHGIYLFELRHPEGLELPAVTPGSHLTVQVPNGARRNYSLCSDPADMALSEDERAGQITVCVSRSKIG